MIEAKYFVSDKVLLKCEGTGKAYNANTINPQGQLAGNLGELAFKCWLEENEFPHTWLRGMEPYDFLLPDDIKIDVKTKKRGVPVRNYFDYHVTSSQQYYDCHVYVFADFIDIDEPYIQLTGWMVKNEFWQSCRLVKRGDKDGDYIETANAGKLTLPSLKSIEELQNAMTIPNKKYSAAPWSYSKIHAFETCPKQFYHERVLKLYPQEETDAMRYGTDFHLAAELYVGSNEPLPERFAFAKEALDMLQGFPGDKIPEMKMGLTKELEPCEFFADDVWWRGICDLTILDRETRSGRIVDYKTGKSARYADTGQLELMAIATFKYFKKLDSVKAALFFVVPKKLVKASYERRDMSRLLDKWLKKFKNMEQAYESDVWMEKQSGLCKAHCPVVECVHNGKNLL